jgi:hypothetical protein
MRNGIVRMSIELTGVLETDRTVFTETSLMPSETRAASSRALESSTSTYQSTHASEQMQIIESIARWYWSLPCIQSVGKKPVRRSRLRRGTKTAIEKFTAALKRYSCGFSGCADHAIEGRAQIVLAERLKQAFHSTPSEKIFTKLSIALGRNKDNRNLQLATDKLTL